MRLLIKTLKDENLKKVQKTAPQYVTIRTAPQTLNKAFLRNLNIPSASRWNHLGDDALFSVSPPSIPSQEITFFCPRLIYEVAHKNIKG